jgi:hypothetical protein
MELDLLVDDVMDELALDYEFRLECLEPLDLFGIDNCPGFNVWGDIFEIVLALAPVPDPVFGEGPSVNCEEKWIQICHIFQS